MDEKLKEVMAQLYREQSRLIEEQDSALAAITAIADNPAVKPMLVMHLRESVRRFYKPEFEQVDISLKVLEYLRG
jgi:hypothetical protein